MNRIMFKALAYGITLGTIFFVIAPLGLGISLIESLKPVLVPSFFLAQGILGNTTGIGSIVFALLLNVTVYTILFSGIFSLRKK
ncbi:hypothetical protein OAU36_02785 [Gammaproteobacteria bacterium]|jgi:hypothetical protein|nr:hypothetical protein [Gammaproteobacteria bacterium]